MTTATRAIEVGDTVRVDPAQYRAPRGARYRVKEMRGGEATVFGGRVNRGQWHTFPLGVLRTVRP